MAPTVAAVVAATGRALDGGVPPVLSAAAAAAGEDAADATGAVEGAGSRGAAAGTMTIV